MDSDPVLNRESSDTREVARIVGDECQPERQGMSRDESVERADWFAAPSQRGCDHTEASGCGLIEGQNFDGLDECADQAVKLPRSACFSTVAELQPRLGHGERNSPCLCRACIRASGEGITEVPNTLLLGAGDLPGPGAQARAEFRRPFIRHFEDDATAFTPNQDLALCIEPTLLWESDSLTAAVLEQLCSGSLHGTSLDTCLYGGQGVQRERVQRERLLTERSALAAAP